MSNLKKCKVCREWFDPDPIEAKVCSEFCAMTYAASARGKLEKVKAIKERKETRAKLDKLKTRGDWVRETQAVFNGFIRARDTGKNCVSCRAFLPAEAVGGGYDCGHYRSVGSAPHLRFVEDNAHGQCKKCNRYLSGNVADYRARLLHRIGPARLDALESDQTPRRYTIDDLKAIKSDYADKTKQLKAQA